MTSADQILSFSNLHSSCGQHEASIETDARQMFAKDLTAKVLISLRPADQLKELSLTHDANVLSLFDELFGLSVLAAFVIPVQNLQVLIPHDQERDLFGNTCLDRYSGAGSHSADLRSAQRQLSSKAGNVAKKRSILVSLDRFRLFELVSRPRLFRANLLKAFSGFLFSQQDHLGGSLRILDRIVMLKSQVQCLLEVCEAMASIPFKFRPCSSRHNHAVMPRGIEYWQTVPLARAADCTFVKAAVLNNRMPLQETPERFHSVRKIRRISHACLINSMQIDVKSVEMCAWINERSEAQCLAQIIYDSKADLTDAAGVTVGSLNVDSDKPVIALQDFGSSWDASSFSVNGFSFSTWISSAKQALQKIHSNWPSILTVQMPISLASWVGSLNNQSKMEVPSAV